MAIAPGHVPERPMFAKRVAPSVARAKQVASSGKGDAPGTYSDTNQGKDFDVRATAKVYLSYFDPEGPAPMPKNASAMKPTPFLWVIGRSDPLFSAGSGYAFDRAPKHPKSKYLAVDARHETTPDIARNEVIAWLAKL
jgi:hypothetical protein